MPSLVRTRTAVLFAALASGAAATLAVREFAFAPSSWLAGQIRAEWESADNESLELYARQLAALDGAGWKSLIRGLRHERPEVRQAAQRTLEEMIDSWRSFPPSDSAPSADRLAQLLADGLDATDSDAVGRSAELAGRLLDWPADDTGGLNRVYYCERVLRAAKELGWPQPDRTEPAPDPPAMADWVAEPAQPAAVPASPPNVRDLPVAETVGPPNRISDATTPAPDPGDSPGVREPLGLQPEPPGTIAEPPRELAVPTEAPPSIAPVTESNPADSSPPDWPSLRLAEVIRHLRSGASASAAEDELRRRGLDEQNLRIARAAADPDSDNRVQLVRALIELRGIDSTGWLLVLTHDQSSRVRAAAIHMLSTASDPRIRAELDKLEQTELDANVRTALQKARAFQR